jgi:hypothetical protein
MAIISAAGETERSEGPVLPAGLPVDVAELFKAQ